MSMGEITNTDRAERAKKSLECYAEGEPRTPESADEVAALISDLIGDLGHLADRWGLEMSELVEDALGMHTEEAAEDAEGEWKTAATLETEAVQTLVELVGDREDEFVYELDEVIHDLASAKAAEVNNGGMESQLRELVAALGTESARREVEQLLERLD